MPSYSAQTDRIAAALIGRHGADAAAIATEGVALVDMLLRKNADYGSSAWRPPVLAPDMDWRAMILVRMSDKIARMATLQASIDPQVNESIADTMRDLAGYCLLYLAGPEERLVESSGVGVRDSEAAADTVTAERAEAAEVAEQAAAAPRTPSRRCINCGLYQLMHCQSQEDLSCWVPRQD